MGIWIAGAVILVIIYLVATGEAKITSNDGCQEWLEEVAADDIRDGFNPPDEAGWYGLGIGVCFLNQTDA